MGKGQSQLVILGIDAGDPDAIERWAEQGYLPTIASVMRQGCWGRTAGPELISEHGVWLILWSGVSRGRHGYYYFRQLKPGDYDLQTVTERKVSARPFWCSLSSGQKVAIIDAPDTFPQPGIPGLQLANWATHHNWDPTHPDLAPASEPGELLGEIYRRYGPPIRIDEQVSCTLQADRRIYRQLLERVRKKGDLCRDLIARDRFDVVVATFSESHTAGHQFWRYRREAQGEVVGPVNSGLDHALRDIYQAIDQELGRILERLASDAHVFILSRNGMADYFPTTGLIEAFCRKLGYQVSSEPAAPALTPMSLLRRTVPEPWRVALSRHLPRETRERLLASQFRGSTDWGRTTAFAIPTFYTSFLRVNLRGREPQGTVQPGAEYDAILSRLEADLWQLVDPHTGECPVEQVVRAVDAFGGSPPDSLPDLFVVWRPGCHFRERVVHPRAVLEQQKPEFFRGSDHTRQGFFAAAGPGIAGRGPIGSVSLLDLAPTFLTLVGERVPEDMTGRVPPLLVSRSGAGAVS